MALDERSRQLVDLMQRHTGPSTCSRWNAKSSQISSDVNATIKAKICVFGFVPLPVPGTQEVSISCEPHGGRGERVYNGDLGMEPPVGSTCRAPGQWIRGTKPHWSWKLFASWKPEWGHRSAPFSGIFKLSKHSVTYVNNHQGPFYYSIIVIMRLS